MDKLHRYVERWFYSSHLSGDVAEFLSHGFWGTNSSCCSCANKGFSTNRNAKDMLHEDVICTIYILYVYSLNTHTHTCTKTKASCAEVMKEDVPFCMIVKQTAWEKEKPRLMTNVSTRSPCQLQWNSRYVTMISRDITSIIQCLRWCKTECAACTPCSSNAEEKYSCSTAHHVKASWWKCVSFRNGVPSCVSCKRSPRKRTPPTSTGSPAQQILNEKVFEFHCSSCKSQLREMCINPKWNTFM